VGPLELVLDGLSRKIKLRGRAGVAAGQAPLGSPFMAISMGGANVFSAGATLTVLLEFSNPLGRHLLYLPRLLAGAGTP
jgi:hypothetical protein